MPQAEIDTLVSWADGGAPEGDPKDLPAPRAFVEGWNIGKPDLVLEMPAAFDVPASGTVDYQYVILPYKFTEDRWVQMAEVRPGDARVVHHVIAFIREPGSKWERDQPAGSGVPAGGERKGERDGIRGDMLAGFAPGHAADILQPGQGRLIKAGSDIVFQLHYTANGKAAQDTTEVGIVFCKTAAARARDVAGSCEQQVHDSRGRPGLSGGFGI